MTADIKAFDHKRKRHLSPANVNVQLCTNDTSRLYQIIMCPVPEFFYRMVAAPAMQCNN